MTCILKSLWPLNANFPPQSRHLSGFSYRCRLVLFVILRSTPIGLSLLYLSFHFLSLGQHRFGFGGIRTHDILTPVKDWLRARRSAWLSYEPSKSIHQLEIFKSKHLISDLNSIRFDFFVSLKGIQVFEIVSRGECTDLLKVTAHGIIDRTLILRE
jgi:hypothetical protein